MVKPLTLLNIAVSLFIWWPTWTRVLSLGSAKQYSLWSFVLIEFLQLSNLYIAVKTKSKALVAFYVVQVVVVGSTLALIADLGARW